MQVKLNDKTVTFPSSLSEITLGQRIDLHETHGRLLDQMLESIMKMPDDTEREIELLGFHFERMFRTFAFFAGTTVEAVKESEFINDVAQIYNMGLALIFQEETNMVQQHEFLFKDEVWTLAPPHLKHGDKMSFGEVIDSKQIVKDMLDLGRGRWEALQRLCVIYLRKGPEQYQEEFMYDGSERMELMRELPLSIALQVGFFLKNLMNFYLGISTFSEKVERSHQVAT